MIEPDAKLPNESPVSSEKTFGIDDPFKVRKLDISQNREYKKGSGRRSVTESDNHLGHYVKARIPTAKSSDLAFDATLRAAAPFQSKRDRKGNAIAIISSDIRDKVRKKRIGTTILFVVDSSGSMGAKKRMAAAKGAILSLLIDAYQKRDRVGLVAFKGNCAELILSPTTSVEMAKNRLKELPTGGKTPLGSGLLKAYDIFCKERKIRKNSHQILILISDGRLNVASRDGVDLMEEVMRVSVEMKVDGISSIILDTETGLLKLGKMRDIAEMLGGIYFPINEIKADIISDLVSRYQQVKFDR